MVQGDFLKIPKINKKFTNGYSRKFQSLL